MNATMAANTLDLNIQPYKGPDSQGIAAITSAFAGEFKSLFLDKPFSFRIFASTTSNFIWPYCGFYFHINEGETRATSYYVCAVVFYGDRAEIIIDDDFTCLIHFTCKFFNSCRSNPAGTVLGVGGGDGLQ